MNADLVWMLSWEQNQCLLRLLYYSLQCDPSIFQAYLSSSHPEIRESPPDLRMDCVSPLTPHAFIFGPKTIPEYNLRYQTRTLQDNTIASPRKQEPPPLSLLSFSKYVFLVLSCQQKQHHLFLPSMSSVDYSVNAFLLANPKLFRERYIYIYIYVCWWDNISIQVSLSISSWLSSWHSSFGRLPAFTSKHHKRNFLVDFLNSSFNTKTGSSPSFVSNLIISNNNNGNTTTAVGGNGNGNGHTPSSDSRRNNTTTTQNNPLVQGYHLLTDSGRIHETSIWSSSFGCKKRREGLKVHVLQDVSRFVSFKNLTRRRSNLQKVHQNIYDQFPKSKKGFFKKSKTKKDYTVNWDCFNSVSILYPYFLLLFVATKGVEGEASEDETCQTNQDLNLEASIDACDVERKEENPESGESIEGWFRMNDDCLAFIERSPSVMQRQRRMKPSCCLGSFFLWTSFMSWTFDAWKPESLESFAVTKTENMENNTNRIQVLSSRTQISTRTATMQYFLDG